MCGGFPCNDVHIIYFSQGNIDCNSTMTVVTLMNEARKSLGAICPVFIPFTLADFVNMWLLKWLMNVVNQIQKGPVIMFHLVNFKL